jgi:UDP-3-O-[3-hydroxymyristoyl] glucosamine N-acyltransferase
MAGAVINASAKIGVQSIINTACVVEHDVVIGDFTMLAPHSTVCGFTKIGNNCWVGAGATINNVIKICDDCIIGAGTVIIENIEIAGTYVGVPAKVIK